MLLQSKGSARQPPAPARMYVISWIKQSIARQAGAIVAGSVALFMAAVWWLGQHAYIPSVSARNLLLAATCLVPGAGLFAAWLAERWLGSRLSHLVDVIDGAGPHDDLARIRNLGQDEVGAIGSAVNRLLARITSIRASMIDQGRELGKAQRELQLRADLAEKTEELAQRLEERAMLFDILRMTSSSPELQDVLRTLVERVGQLLRLREAVFYIHRESSQEFVAATAYGFADGTKLVGRSLKIGEGISGRVGATREPLIIEDLRSVAEYQGFWNLAERSGSLAAVPVINQGQLLGVLTVTRPDQEPLTDVHLRLLCAIADSAALAIRNAQLFEHMRALTTHDELTGLPNQKLMRTQLESEVDRARRFELPLSVIVLEVRCPAAPAGEQVRKDEAAIRVVGSLLAAGIRKVDLVARAGTSRFVVLLPRTDAVEAAQVAGKLCKAMLGLSDGPARGVALELGIAQLAQADDDQGSALLARAEQALAPVQRAGLGRQFVA